MQISGSAIVFTEKKSYIAELLCGNYASYSEDRLTQAFSATFNHSAFFRNAVAGFFGFSTRGCISSTQMAYRVAGKSAVPDILISKSKSSTPIAVIENKVDAPLTNVQLRKYDKIKTIKKCHRICLVRSYYEPTFIRSRWNVKYWSDLHAFLSSLQGYDFLSSNFIALLKEYGMERPGIISKSDLKALAMALYQIRFRDKPYFSYNGPVFETLLSLKLFLENLFRKAAKEKILVKRTGKAFRATLRVSWWYDSEKKGKEWLWIGCETRLSKVYKEIKGFGAAFLCYDKPTRYDVIAYVLGKYGDWDDPVKTYPKKDINCPEFDKIAIKYWTRKLK